MIVDVVIAATLSEVLAQNYIKNAASTWGSAASKSAVLVLAGIGVVALSTGFFNSKDDSK